MKKRRILRSLGITLAVLLLVLGIGPFLVPVPPLEGTKTIQELADADSLFVEINGLTVHYKTMGQGEPVFVLLHGFGASLFSWHAVMEPLSRYGTVIAYDRPAFGLTGRPMTWQAENPYGPQAQVDLLLGLLDSFSIERAILVGNSAGGTVAMQFYLQHPERVQSLILVDPAIYEGSGGPSWVRILGKTPQMQHLGPLFVRSIQSRGLELIDLAWYDPSLITQETLDGYTRPLQADNWDRALWFFTLASQPADLPGRLAEFNLPVLVVTGDTDRIVPTEQSLQLAEELPDASLSVIPQAGHVPHEERPDLFMQAVADFLAAHP
jgi:pimeloyl-ACP methyl ester carboxylesterase